MDNNDCYEGPIQPSTQLWSQESTKSSTQLSQCTDCFEQDSNKNCKFYYYIEDNKYKCTNDNNCPEKFNKLIISNNECSNNCNGKLDYLIQ